MTVTLKEKPTQSQAPSLMFMFHKRQIFSVSFQRTPSQSETAGHFSKKIDTLPINVYIAIPCSPR